MRYIYKCIRCEKDIEEVQGASTESLCIEGAMCRECCRTSVKLYSERTVMGMKKKHWTQTREGKKKMKAARQKQWATMRESNEDAELLSAMADGLKVRKKKKRIVEAPRPKADDLQANDFSIRSLLGVLFDRAEDMQEAARQIADKLGLEL